MREFCRRILEAPGLEAKLAPRPEARPGSGPARPGAADSGALEIDAPARAPGLELGSGSGALPRPGELHDPAARAVCLARFAHHELMAVELFAWALLRWPEVPGALQQGWLAVLADEQRHCALYLERLAAHGLRLEAFAPHSGYFWKHAPAMASGGPLAFLAGMGLTLEQANLDFTTLYRDAFAEAGDDESARVCARVHAEEVGHVALAAEWLERLSDEADPVVRYETLVPFPLCAARAKGRRFDAAGRAAAGLAPALVEHVRCARPAPSRRARS